MKTDILLNGSTVNNHISLKTGFGYNATRRTSFLLWFQAYQVRPLDLHQLQRHLQDRRVIPHHFLPPHLLHLQLVKFRLENEEIELRVTPVQCTCQLRLMTDRGDLMITKPIKSQNQIKRNPRRNRVTRCIPKSQNGCKNSEKFWWMMKFLNAETHTPVLLMKYLYSSYSRDVRICVNTVFILISL